MRNFWLGLTVVAGLGCSNLGPDRPLVVVSNAPSFAMSAGATFTITNRSDRSHTFQACGPSGKIDRHGSNGWTEFTAFNQVCIGISSLLTLAPGQSHQLAISVNHPSFLGTLRIRLTEGERILAVSNEFSVTN